MFDPMSLKILINSKTGLFLNNDVYTKVFNK